MFNHKQNILVAALLMACASSAFASDTAVLTIKGKILPGACSANFNGKNEVDFGNINVAQLKPKDVTIIGTGSVQLDVICPSVTRIAVTIVDNKSTTAAELSSNLHSNGSVLGLGLTNGKNKIGGYVITLFTTAQGDGVNTDYLTRPDAGAHWEKKNGSLRIGSFYTIAKGHHQTEAGAFKIHAYSMLVSGYIVGTDALDLKDEITLDGQATFEISYI